ncbi:hypothetical protein Hena1_00140 [Erwinia phage Hena1]|uniref:Uncharacterized protein n=1 Tax=Erwinia phage Hena1 TaxID=2678601 RepID=A0A6B9J5E7_9CAUD|nr:hypothetical protein HWC84_gp013 [Erwinia phage Hena1]QGZ16190.1 hypothetical protein Hena1_00140 [Erwinia phage Hena1]
MDKILSFIMFIVVIALPITFADVIVAAYVEKVFELGVAAAFFTTLAIVILSSVPGAWLWHKLEKLLFKRVVV